MRTERVPSSLFQVCRRGLALAGVFSLGLNLLMLSVPLYMMSVYDRVLTGRSVDTLLMLTLVVLGALAMVGILETVRQMILARTAARLETELGDGVLTASLKAGQNSGSGIQGLRDLGQLRQFISSPLVTVLFDAPMAPIYLAVVFLVHPQLGWLSLAAALAILLIAIANQYLTESLLSEATRFSLSALQKAQAQARNVEAVRAMGMFSQCVDAWGEDNAKALAASDAAAKRNAVFTGASQFLRLFLQIAVLGYGAYLVLADHSLSAGIIFAASMMSARALGPLNQMVSGWRSIVSAQQAWRRLRVQLAAVPGQEVWTALPEPDATLSVEKLIYRAGTGAEPILKSLSFKIEAGEVVGVIGQSGAGKSTLARILVGAIAPTGGIVRIGGYDFAHWRPEALGPFIGYLPQDVELFPVSIAQNIARMSHSPNPEKVIAAARLANCHELIQCLPQGYDTVLGSQGHILSGGQRQRIALARAFYDAPKVVVLDEPNASLDGEGEQALVAALHKAREAGITCVVITQRTSIAPALTKMMVLRDGRVEAFGPKDEVLRGILHSAASSSEAAAPPIFASHRRPASISGSVTARFG